MITFSEYFYRFKDMMLNKDIPCEFRAMYIVEKGMAATWRRHFNHYIYTDSDQDNASKSNVWSMYQHSFWYALRHTTVKNIETIMDMNMRHPEITASDLVMALILWGRGPAIVKKVLEVNSDIPEYDEMMKVLAAVKKLTKERKGLPKPRFGYW